MNVHCMYLYYDINSKMHAEGISTYLLHASVDIYYNLPISHVFLES